MQNSPLSPQAAAQTLLTRRRARASLIEFARLCGFEPAAHHRLLIEKLEAVARDDIDRLMVFMPPGSAKSTYCSVLFPPWYLAQHPDHALIAASHTQELAERWGRRVRNLIAEHANTLSLALSVDSSAAGRWETEAGGEYYAAGVGGIHHRQTRRPRGHRRPSAQPSRMPTPRSSATNNGIGTQPICEHA